MGGGGGGDFSGCDLHIFWDTVPEVGWQSLRRETEKFVGYVIFLVAIFHTYFVINVQISIEFVRHR